MHEIEFEKPICTIDAVLVRICEETLEVGLIRRPEEARVYAGAMALPGGFVHTDVDQTINDTLYRNLESKVNLTPAYLTKLEFDGNMTRDPEGWSITCPYLCFINGTSGESGQIEWFPLKQFVFEKPHIALPFDHLNLIKQAFFRLYNRAKYSTEPNYFFGSDFTLSELQKVYEIVLGKEIHKKNFRDRIDESGSIENTGESRIVKRSRAQLFKNKQPVKTHFFSRVLQGAYDDA